MLFQPTNKSERKRRWRRVLRLNADCLSLSCFVRPTNPRSGVCLIVDALSPFLLTMFPLSNSSPSPLQRCAAWVQKKKRASKRRRRVHTLSSFFPRSLHFTHTPNPPFKQTVNTNTNNHGPRHLQDLHLPHQVLQGSRVDQVPALQM